jgi:hemolysin III
MLGSRPSNVYTRAERLSDAAVHVTGVLSALLAAPVLITLSAVWLGDRGFVIATMVYAFSLIGMLTCSAVYHMLPAPQWKNRLRRIDQSVIYLKIAGTYTPFAVLAGGAGLFLAAIWSAAVAGAAMILFGPEWLRRPSLLLYLAIGWVGVVAGQPLFAGMSQTGFALLLAGGCLYTFGIFFFLWERLPFHNTIWHICVLAATALLYSAILAELWSRSAGLDALNFT